MARNSTWRNADLKRDGYRCQCCGYSDITSINDLVAHHLESFETNIQLRKTVSNGVTLCKYHHDEFHRRYGKDQNNASQFREFKRECLR